MSADAAVAVAWDVFKIAFVRIKRQFEYVMCSKRYAEDLQKEVGNLGYQDQRVRNAKDEAANNLQDIYEWVPQFLANAENAMKEAGDLLGKFQEASKSCCGGTLPDLKCRHQFSRMAKRKSDDIQKLILQIKDKEISFSGTAPGNVAARYADELRKEVENLEYEAARVRNAAVEATNNLRNTHEWVEKFLASAEAALREARGLLGEFEEASKTCCVGTLPDPNCLYQFSRKAKHKTDDIKNLILENSNKEIFFSGPALNPGGREGKDVVQSTTTTATSILSTSMSVKLRDHGVFESRALVIRHIMDALADNSKSVVGVYGMGGVGKSTLLEDVKRVLTEERSFEWVAMADVSKNPSIHRIQGEIAAGLRLTDMKNEDPVRVRAELLHKRLEKEEREKKKVLIILDNLWEQLDLKSVGIPCGPDNKAIGCKLLLTSRDQRLLQREMGCAGEFLLGGLEEEEARALFERTVGEKVHDDQFKPWVEVALHRCAGVPFLIVAIAKRFKNAELFEWKDALRNMEKFNHEEINGLIDDMLEWSYDRLKDEAKALLRLCVVSSASKPSLEDLVRYSFGLGLFQLVGSLEEATDRSRSHIRNLQASALLLDSEDVSGFKIHDLVRDFVASVSSRDHHPLLVLEDKVESVIELPGDKLESCEAMYFPNMKELPPELNCPQLRILLLSTNGDSFHVQDSYFNSMRNLRVLNLTGIRLTCSPSPFQFLANLRTLCFHNCSFEDVAILGNLKGLQVLSIVDSEIQRLPKEIGQLVELRSLDLSSCSKLEIIEPGVLGSLIRLEELYMEKSFNQWNAVEKTPPTNASLIELNNMKNLHTLHVSIPDPSVLPKDLNFKELTKFRIIIGYGWWPSAKYKGSRTLQLKWNPTSDFLHKECIQNILLKTDELLLDEFNVSEQSIYGLSLEGFPQLKHLQVEDSPSVHSVLERSSVPAFKALETLLLNKLINLKKITSNNISTGSFSTLKVVRVDGCDKMEILFPRSVVRDLPQLEEIKVMWCELMRGIVEADDGRGILVLPKLRVLKLFWLPNIKNFITARSSPSSSTSADQVGTQIAFFNGQQVAFPSLETLEVYGLGNLGFMFSPSMVKSLAQLRILTVHNCEKMEAVIMEEAGLGVEISETLAFPMLSDLCLYNLRSLMCFSHKKCSQEGRGQDRVQSCSNVLFNEEVAFPSLETLEVNRLGNLEFLFSPSMVKSLAQLRILTVHNCEKMEAVIMEEAVLGVEISKTLAFPMLSDLCLYNMGSLTCFSHKKCSQEGRGQGRVQSCSNVLFNGEVDFPRLETLEIKGLHNLGFMFYPSMVKSLAQLRNLTIWSCEKMEVIITKEEGLGMETSETLAFPMLTDLRLVDLKSLACFSREKRSRESQSQEGVQSHSSALFNREVAFPRLERLYIKGMDNIKMIWDGRIAVDSFPKLNWLYVDECNKLVNVVPSIVLGQLLSLEMLEARSCGSLKVVFKYQPLNPLDGHSVARSPLKKLKLFDLPELKCIWDKKLHRQVKFQCLRSLSVSQCLSLTSLFPASIANDLMQFEKSKVDRCGVVELIEKKGLEERSINVEVIQGTSHELSNMVTPTMATNLVALTKLRISKCGLLTEVISDEEGREGHVVAFNQLKHIELDGLTGLRCFYSGGYALMLPLLEKVIVTGCPKMKIFSEGPIEAPKLERVQISEEARFWNGNLNITIQNMFDEMVSIGGVRNMLLSEFPELIGKWHSELNPIKSSWQLESLTVDKCPSFINAIPSRLMLVLDNMNKLQVRDCESLEEIFDLQGLEAMESTQLLPSFKSLDLVNLPKLRQLWNKDLQGTIHVNYLSSITLYKCSNLRHAFTPSMAQCLASLRRMKIKECGQMEGVIVEEEWQGGTMEKTTFPELIWLKLECLPNLTSFLLGKNHTLDCPKLEELTITHCPNMRSLAWQSLTEIDDGTPSLFTPQVQFPQLESIVLAHMDNLSNIWTDDPPETLTFEHLRKLKALNCKSLENLFPQWVATSLNQLEKVRVESCGIEEIVANGDDTPHSTTAQVLFPKLISLVLHDMPRLKSFCPSLRTLNWPFLKKLRVTHCDKMNMLSFATFMNERTQRDNQQDLSNQEAQTTYERDFPNLKRLSLSDKNIQMIQDGNFPDDNFGKFGKCEALALACFHDENAVFPSKFLLERFQNLEIIELFCSSFEDIFPDEGLVDEGKHLVLEKLRELKLSKLHNLKRVWSGDYFTSKILQSIETLKVCDCPGLMTVFPAVTSFRNLTKLVVKNSSGLVHLGTASAIANLVNLFSMAIIGCARMKEVTAKDENEDEKVISFENLRRLRLQNLPSLEYFSSTTSCVLRFPSLCVIEVEECPKMNIFSNGMVSTPGLEDGTLFGHRDWYDHWEGDLNRAIQKLSA